MEYAGGKIEVEIKFSDESQKLMRQMKKFDMSAFLKWYEKIHIIGSRTIMEYIVYIDNIEHKK